MCYDFKELTEICISQMRNVHTFLSKYKSTEDNMPVVLTSNEAAGFMPGRELVLSYMHPLSILK